MNQVFKVILEMPGGRAGLNVQDVQQGVLIALANKNEDVARTRALPAGFDIKVIREV